MPYKASGTIVTYGSSPIPTPCTGQSSEFPSTTPCLLPVMRILLVRVLLLVRNVRVLCSLVQGKNRMLWMPHVCYPNRWSQYESTSSRTDPLVHYGRHFGRTIHALCTVSALLNNGLLSMEQVVKADEPLTHEYVQVRLSFGMFS